MFDEDVAPLLVKSIVFQRVQEGFTALGSPDECVHEARQLVYLTMYQFVTLILALILRSFRPEKYSFSSSKTESWKTEQCFLIFRWQQCLRGWGEKQQCIKKAVF